MSATAATDQLGGFLHEDLLRVYRETGTIAVVGASDSPDKPAHRIPAYMQTRGYRIIPVIPRGGDVFGEPAMGSLVEVGKTVDVVDIFRPPVEAEAVARHAIEIGAKVLWFQPGSQPGTHTGKAVELAEPAALEALFDICVGATHRQRGLGPGPG